MQEQQGYNVSNISVEMRLELAWTPKISLKKQETATEDVTTQEDAEPATEICVQESEAHGTRLV